MLGASKGTVNVIVPLVIELFDKLGFTYKSVSPADLLVLILKGFPTLSISK